MDESNLEEEADENYSPLRLNQDVVLLSGDKGSSCSLFSVKG